MLKTSSKARKQNLGLTVTQATSQARRHVDKLMPGVMATVDSRGSYDLKADVPTVITTVTFPAGHPSAEALHLALYTLPDIVVAVRADSSIVITRTR